MILCYTCLSVKEYRCQTGIMLGLVKRETGANPVRSRRCNMGIRYKKCHWEREDSIG